MVEGDMLRRLQLNWEKGRKKKKKAHNLPFSAMLRITSNFALPSPLTTVAVPVMVSSVWFIT
jgi:hypothetical protein